MTNRTRWGLKQWCCALSVLSDQGRRQGWFLGASVLGVGTAALSLCPRVVSVCVLIFLSYEDSSQTGPGPTLVTSSYLNHLLKAPPLNAVTCGGAGGLDFHVWIWGDTIQPTGAVDPWIRLFIWEVGEVVLP